MSEPRMLAGSVALALLMVGWVVVQGCRNAAAPPRVFETPERMPEPRAADPLPMADAAAKAAAPTSPLETADPGPKPPSATAPGAGGNVMVHVVGAVRKPGVYQLPAKARLREALQAAGGAKPGADLEAVNLASFVQDGEQIRVPSLAERRAAERQLSMSAATAMPRAPRSSRAGAPDRPTRSTSRYPQAASTAASKGTASTAGAAAMPMDGPVNINTAGVAELDTLPGVGPSTAEAILRFRREHGPFRSVEDLLEVPGIGDRKLAAMRDRVVVK